MKFKTKPMKSRQITNKPCQIRQMNFWLAVQGAENRWWIACGQASYQKVWGLLQFDVSAMAISPWSHFWSSSSDSVNKKDWNKGEASGLCLVWKNDCSTTKINNFTAWTRNYKVPSIVYQRQSVSDQVEVLFFEQTYGGAKCASTSICGLENIIVLFFGNAYVQESTRTLLAVQQVNILGQRQNHIHGLALRRTGIRLQGDAQSEVGFFEIIGGFA